ncbi:hypothetical protein BDV19DRAFT_382678 [Aspergillus venezuelensis]
MAVSADNQQIKAMERSALAVPLLYRSTGLDILRERSFVDCDTLDEEVVNALRPSQDCTANQALAVTELSKPENRELIREALVTVKLALKIVPYINGYIHIQTNPEYAHDTSKTTANGFKIVYIFQYLAQWFNPTRICIQIPIAGIRTSATTLITFDQAILATEVGCTYVAPYVNQVNIHIEQQDHSQKLLSQCADIQRSFKDPLTKKKVIASSLTSTEEVFALAGAHTSRFLRICCRSFRCRVLRRRQRLCSTPNPLLQMRSCLLRKKKQVRYQPVRTVYARDEASYRAAFSQADGGVGAMKLTQV